MPQGWTLRLITALATLLLGATGLHAETDQRAAAQRGIAAAVDVGKAVQKALKDATATGLAGLVLEKATLTLETGQTVDPGGEFNLAVLTASFGQTKQNTVSQTLVFATEPAGEEASLADLADPLAQAIAAAAATAAEINALPLVSATIKIEFVVEKSMGGGIGFKLLAELGGDVNIDLTKTSKNALELRFGPEDTGRT